MEAPLFADEEDEGFNTAGLIGIVVVVIAIVAVILVLNKDDKKPDQPKETTPIAVVEKDMAPAKEPDMGKVAETTPATPDLGQAADMNALAAAPLTAETAEPGGLATAQDVHRTSANQILLHSGIADPINVEDPVAFLASREADMGNADMGAGDMGAEAKPDMNAVAVNTTTPPVEKKPELTPEQKLDKDLDSIERMLNREQYGKAKSRIGKIAKAHPNNGRVAALAGRSEVYDNSSRAIREINRAKGLGYNSAEMYLDLATAYFLSGNKGQAKSTYETFLKRYPKHKRAGEIRAILKNQF